MGRGSSVNPRFDDVRAIRDLISGHPLQPALMDDLDSWGRLCDGVDGIDPGFTPGFTPERRITSLNAVRAELGMPAVEVDGTDDPAAVLAAGVAAVRAELEAREHAHYDRFADPLLPILGNEATTLHAVGKIAEAVASELPGESPSPAGLGLGWIKGLRSSLSRIDEEMRRRRLREDMCSGIEDALYVLERLAQLFASAPDAPPARDAYLLANDVLRTRSEALLRRSPRSTSSTPLGEADGQAAARR